MEKKPPTFKRSLSLSKKMNDDLLALTSALGINAHSYMINELAKSIQRDSLSLNINSSTNNVLSDMLNTFNTLMIPEKDITQELEQTDKKAD